MQEPVDQWLNNKDEQGENILEKFYKNQEKYAFPFQMIAYISLLHLIRETVKKHPGKIIITERCPHTDKYVFAQMLYDDKKIETVCYNIYNSWFDAYLEDFSFEKVIYINADPETCYDRIGKRSRQGETIPLAYLQRCHTYHEKWLKNGKYNVTELDGNQEFEHDKEIFDKWKQIIKELYCQKN